jgi:hypothetical protein
MNGERIFLDDQGGQVMQVLSKDVSPTIMQNAGKAHALIVCEPRQKVDAFAQNTREEVRMLGDVAGCVSAEPGTHQTTYVCIKKKVRSTMMSANPKSFGVGCDTEVSGTLLESLYKDPPLVFRKARHGNP